MKKSSSFVWPALLFICTFVLDRITKHYALDHFTIPLEITQFLSFELAFNRGVTAGMFHTHNNVGFIVLSIFVACIALSLAIYTYVRWKSGKAIFAEALVLSGAVSNLIDRCIYGAVIDFIALSYQDWHFPIFNIADACIVIGIGIIFLLQINE